MAIIQEQGKGILAFEDVIDGFGVVMAAAEFGALLAALSAGECPDRPRLDLCWMPWSRRCMIATLYDETS